MAEHTDHPHLNKAPIVEAMISVHTEAVDRAAFKTMEELNAGISKEFPTAEVLSEYVETETGSSKRVNGFRLLHYESKYAFSVNLDGMSFSRFAPYDTWEDLTENAERIWNHYSACFEPLALKDFSIRYINDLVLPATEDINTYLKTHIHVPDDFVSNAVSNLFFRLEMPIAEDNALLTLQEALKGRMNDSEVSVILDYQLNYPALGMKRERLWGAIKSKRKQKNQVFWGCITERMEAKLR